MTRLDVGTKGAWKKVGLEKREDETTDGDGVVTMKTHRKKIWINLHVNGHMVVRPDKECIPLVTHR